MNVRLGWLLGAVLGIGCCVGCDDGGGGGGLSNANPGANDRNVVVAFGDSLTQGNMCACTPYPERLAGLIGKVVVNTGVHGSAASLNVDRTQAAIDRFHPAFMLILYGVGDVIHGFGAGGAMDALADMVQICRDNHVVPVLATYPEPIAGYVGFAAQTLLLNERIRTYCGEQDVPCVDLEKEFQADPTLYESEGLHPNDAGTQIMALAFADLF